MHSSLAAVRLGTNHEPRPNKDVGVPHQPRHSRSLGHQWIASQPHNAPWAQRAHRAHLNMIENLPAFATLVIIAQLTETSVSGAAALFFWARVLHAVVFILGIPYIRTLAFVASWIAMLSIFFSVI